MVQVQRRCNACFSPTRIRSVERPRSAGNEGALLVQRDGCGSGWRLKAEDPKDAQRAIHGGGASRCAAGRLAPSRLSG